MRRDDFDDDDEEYEDDDFDSEFERPRPPERPRRSGVPRWLIILGAVFVVLPVSCCGGILWWTSTFKDFELSNGEHLGGAAMNVRFDYHIKIKDIVLKDAYLIVAETADGVTRDRPVPRSFPTRGTWYFNALDVGPAEPKKSPVKVWLEKEDMRGNRSRASNVIRIELKTGK